MAMLRICDVCGARVVDDPPAAEQETEVAKGLWVRVAVYREAASDNPAVMRIAGDLCGACTGTVFEAWTDALSVRVGAGDPFARFDDGVLRPGPGQAVEGSDSAEGHPLGGRGLGQRSR